MEDRTTIHLVELDKRVQLLKNVKVPKKFYERITLGVQSLDEIFGGLDTPGIVPGTTFMFTGSPGAGKSTMSLQLADLLQLKSKSVLYNIGEESKYMVKMRADRIGLKQEYSVSQIVDVDELCKYVKKTGVEILFQDSIQSLTDGKLHGGKLLKSIVKKLVNLSKTTDVTNFLVGHITKGGGFAGPQELEHDVDGRAHLSLNKDNGNRIFCMTKNRFGASGMPYEFVLSANGLDFKPVKNVEPDGGSKEPAQRGASHREKVKASIKEALLRGESVSGYCFERLKIDCSGGFFRGMLASVVKDLQSEGKVVGETRTDGRAHWQVIS